MRCPRCGSDNERDVSKVPCSRCGLLVKMPQRSNSKGRPVSQRQQIRKTLPGLHSIPHRPLTQPYHTRTTENLLMDMERAVHSLYFYPSDHLVTDSLMESEQAFSPASQVVQDTSLQNGVMLVHQSSRCTPGMLLHGGRYRLQEYRGYQGWRDGVYEATWIAQDAQRAGMQVVICELAIPDEVSLPVQSMLRLATLALTSIGRHPHVPTLWDAFSEQRESFFVFEPTDGETLQERMRRTGRAIPEQSVLEMCLQVLDVLGSASQQMPPLIHGLIRPEHIVISHSESEYIVTNFSIVLAGKAAQLVKGIDTTQVSPYFSAEFVQGKVDICSDLFALVATMYHTVTGSLPDEIDGEIPEAQRLNPLISSGLNALLAKGLHPFAENRFQTPFELRQAVITLQHNTIAMNKAGDDARAPLQQIQQEAPIEASLSTQEASTATVPTFGTTTNGSDEKQPGLLPSQRDETVLYDERKATRFVFTLIIGIVLCLLLVLVLWHFLLY